MTPLEISFLTAFSLTVIALLSISAFGCYWCYKNKQQSDKLDTLIRGCQESTTNFLKAYKEISSKLDEREKKVEDPSGEPLVDQKVDQLERKSEQLDKEIESLQNANDVLIKQVAKLQSKEAKKVRIGNTVPIEIHHGN